MVYLSEYPLFKVALPEAGERPLLRFFDKRAQKAQVGNIGFSNAYDSIVYN